MAFKEAKTLRDHGCCWGLLSEELELRLIPDFCLLHCRPKE